MKPLLALALTFLLLGCADDAYKRRPGFPSPTIGMWPNLYANNPNLAAVMYVERGPNSFGPGGGFTQRRPGSITYAFWDGRVRQIDYGFNGGVIDSFWWPPKAWLKPGSVNWSGFDFNYGSDPTFVRHRDPRLPPGPPPAASGGH